MDLGLRGKRALVAAASEGIAFATAQRLVSEGAHVAIFSRSADKIERAADSLRADAPSAVQVIAAPVDATDRASVTRFVESVEEQLGGLDICVPNAGGPPARLFLETSDEEWQRAVELNLLSTVALCRAVLPGMQRQRWGRIVAITSVSTRQPVSDLVYSNTVRAGVLGLLKSLSNEFGADGITVNNVAPGYTLTARMRELVSKRAAAAGLGEDAYLAQLMETAPLRRAGKAEEIADSIVFLASERASYITGQTLLVDGGLFQGI